jgi:N6-adenosine-specific RNA methylase IME4
MLDAESLSELSDSIGRNGLRNPIILFDGQILDGRNRLLACRMAGVEPRYEELVIEDPASWVIDQNLHRRHLNESQRAMVASKFAGLGHGGDRSKGQICTLKIDEAAEKLSVSPRTVKSARKVQDKGTPELVQAVEQGDVAVSTAADVAELPQDEQVELVARGEKEIVAAAKEIRARKAKERKSAKLEHAKAMAIDQKGYRVVYADPPWQYSNSGVIGDDNYGRAERHYPTMSIDELCAMPIVDAVAQDAVLFMWVTSPLLAECWPVISAWGFKYKSSFVWDKVRHNFGHYNSVRHELLLICTRGSCTPDASEKINSVQRIERSTRHSEKPEEFYDIIEKLYVSGLRLELFARQPRVGWDSWGNEA